MSNWIEDNPIKSMVTYTIAIIAATVAVMYFILDESKENLHKAQVENLKTQVQSNDERVKLLQYENSNLLNENNKLRQYLISTPGSFEYLTEKIKNLESTRELLLDSMSFNHLTGHQPEDFSDKAAGSKWTYNSNNAEFDLIIIELNYIGNRFKVAIREK